MPTSARRNHAGGARLLQGEWEKPSAQGTQRYVARGVYTSGHRKGQACVIKWSKHVTSLVSQANAPFASDIRAVATALDIVAKWNAAEVSDTHVRLNVPEVWHLSTSDPPLAVLIEPYIPKFQKWNSNSGWSNGADDAWTRCMSAFSHFSYEASNGELVLCDLQGGTGPSGFVLTDPAINSVGRKYGPTDLGISGITSFFAHHKCNEFCRSSWRVPPPRAQPRVRFAVARGTQSHDGLRERE